MILFFVQSRNGIWLIVHSTPNLLWLHGKYCLFEAHLLHPYIHIRDSVLIKVSTDDFVPHQFTLRHNLIIGRIHNLSKAGVSITHSIFYKTIFKIISQRMVSGESKMIDNRKNENCGFPVCNPAVADPDYGMHAQLFPVHWSFCPWQKSQPQVVPSCTSTVFQKHSSQILHPSPMLHRIWKLSFEY